MPAIGNPKIVRNFNLYVDGVNYAGRVAEVTLPKLAIKTEEFRGGGMDAPIEVDMGMEKIEVAFTIAEHDPRLYRQFGLVDGNSVALTLRGALQDDAEQAVPMVISLRGMYREIDGGAFKAGEMGEIKVTVTCRYYRLRIGDRDLVELDIENMRRVIDGIDQMASIREALGL